VLGDSEAHRQIESTSEIWRGTGEICGDKVGIIDLQPDATRIGPVDADHVGDPHLLRHFNHVPTPQPTSTTDVGDSRRVTSGRAISALCIEPGGWTA